MRGLRPKRVPDHDGSAGGWEKDAGLDPGWASRVWPGQCGRRRLCWSWWARAGRVRLVTGIQPELWVDHADRAIAFYADAFGATLLHRVGEGDEVVAQLAVGEAAFWVASAGPGMGRFSPTAIGGGTSRMLLVVEQPDAVVKTALAAGATELSPVSDEHGWRLGRVVDPFGHEWEIGRPIGVWPPS